MPRWGLKDGPQLLRGLLGGPGGLSKLVNHCRENGNYCILFRVEGLGLVGPGDLVSRVMMGITRVTSWVIGVINILTKSP